MLAGGKPDIFADLSACFFCEEDGGAMVYAITEFTELARDVDASTFNVNTFTANVPVVSEPAKHSPAASVESDEEWTADRDGRRALVDLIKRCAWESLDDDPVFYAAVKVKYPRRLQDLHAVSIAELSDLVASIYVSWEQYAGGTPGTAAAVGVLGDDKADRDGILEKLLSRLVKIEAFIKTQRMGGAPAVLPKKRNRKGLDGFRVGVSHDPRVGFDPGAKKALPRCPRCPTAGDEHRYDHAWADCPLGGKRHPAGSTAAYCQPVEDCTTEVLHTLALCQVYQAAADSGKDAFATAVEQHGAPAVVRAGAASGRVDISAYGFAVVDSDERVRGRRN
ncbi:hypothetical protein CYMTET_16850 [Cymbomonas tetramitiformis]|uniref:Uncharacterized protein n=1 Tax=Cymbomonas tetramitiformis TaxID=36881 RepID=A0AAE0L7V4_9CHLO|nr:hypothetical protein CYMTET_16850 [Cymbomonas tetramitiformis]